MPTHAKAQPKWFSSGHHSSEWNQSRGWEQGPWSSDQWNYRDDWEQFDGWNDWNLPPDDSNQWPDDWNQRSPSEEPDESPQWSYSKGKGKKGRISWDEEMIARHDAEKGSQRKG